MVSDVEVSGKEEDDGMAKPTGHSSKSDILDANKALEINTMVSTVIKDGIPFTTEEVDSGVMQTHSTADSNQLLTST